MGFSGGSGAAGQREERGRKWGGSEGNDHGATTPGP